MRLPRLSHSLTALFFPSDLARFSFHPPSLYLAVIPPVYDYQTLTLVSDNKSKHGIISGLVSNEIMPPLPVQRTTGVSIAMPNIPSGTTIIRRPNLKISGVPFSQTGATTRLSTQTSDPPDKPCDNTPKHLVKLSSVNHA